MKNIIYILLIISFANCKSSKQNKSKKSINNLKKNQFTGVIITKDKPKINNSDISIPEAYFRTNQKDYFIKFSEGYVTKDNVLKYKNKQIIIKGEIKQGLFENMKPASFGNKTPPPPPRSGEYITIEKIYKKQ
jgi:hypothetical protein